MTKRFFPIFVLAILTVAMRRAGDWPQYRADAARGGYVPEQLTGALGLAWTYESAHAPAPAWPTNDRLSFDQAFQPVIAGGALYYGSSVDGKVYALDAATGRQRWAFFTDGPIRFAPVVWKQRVYVASDDGYLYCLSAGDGQLVWKFRGGPGDRMILGNDRMTSAWPARGGPVFLDGIVYFGAGVWPFRRIPSTRVGRPEWQSALVEPGYRIDLHGPTTRGGLRPQRRRGAGISRCSRDEPVRSDRTGGASGFRPTNR